MKMSPTPTCNQPSRKDQEFILFEDGYRRNTAFVGYSKKGGTRSENMSRTMRNIDRLSRAGGHGGVADGKERFTAYGEDVGDWGDMLRSDEVVQVVTGFDENGEPQLSLTRTGVHASVFPEDVEDMVATLASRAEDEGVMGADEFREATKFTYLPNGRVNLVFPSEGIVDDTVDMDRDESNEYRFMSSKSTMNEDGEVEEGRSNKRVHGTMEDYNEFRRARAAENLKQAMANADLSSIPPFSRSRVHLLEDGSVIVISGDEATIDGKKIDADKARAIAAGQSDWPVYGAEFHEKMKSTDMMTVLGHEGVVVFEDGSVYELDESGLPAEVGTMPGFFVDPEGAMEDLDNMVSYKRKVDGRKAREQIKNQHGGGEEGEDYARRVDEAGIDPLSIPEEFRTGEVRPQGNQDRDQAQTQDPRGGTGQQEQRPAGDGREMRQRLQSGEPSSPIVTEDGRIVFVMSNGDMFYADSGECLLRPATGGAAGSQYWGPTANQWSGNLYGSFGSSRRQRGIERLMPPPHRRLHTSPAKAVLDYDSPCWPWSRQAKARKAASEWLDGALNSDPELMRTWQSLSISEQTALMADHERQFMGLMPQRRSGLFGFFNPDRPRGIDTSHEAPMPDISPRGAGAGRQSARPQPQRQGQQRR